MARDRASRPEAAALRLFVAVDIPDTVKEQLSGSLEPLKPVVPAARWTRPDGWHVTLKFLGATWPRLLPLVRDAVTSVGAGTDAFSTRLAGIGAFPSPRRARVVWAGLLDAQGRMRGMASDLDAALADEFPPEKRAFTAHLTLARLNPPQDLTSAPADVLATPVVSPSFLVDRLVLYRSHLSPRGARYEPLTKAPLKRPDSSTLESERMFE